MSDQDRDEAIQKIIDSYEKKRTLGNSRTILEQAVERAGFALVPAEELAQLRADSGAYNADLAGTVEVESRDACLEETGAGIKEPEAP